MSRAVDDRWLLIKTCQDLAKKSQSPELYDKLRMAGLLAQLLLGPRALARRIAAAVFGNIEFWYREPHAQDAESWKSPVGFDASSPRGSGGKTQRESLEAFLQARVIFLQRWWTVEQVIASVAHVYGGLYATVPPETGERDFLIFNEEVNQAGGAGIVPIALHEITQVALRALMPLAEIAGVNFAKKGDRAVAGQADALKPDAKKLSDAQAQSAKCPFHAGIPDDE